jgi:hemin uptake protein HemP
MKNPGAGRATYGPGRYIRPPQILAGNPDAQAVLRVTKCPQIATKPARSATIRTRTDDKPEAFDVATGDGLVQTAREVPSEKLELLGPDGRLALDRDGAGALRDGARGSG